MWAGSERTRSTLRKRKKAALPVIHDGQARRILKVYSVIKNTSNAAKKRFGNKNVFQINFMRRVQEPLVPVTNKKVSLMLFNVLIRRVPYQNQGLSIGTAYSHF
jgi:hypothetical protein